MQSAANKSEQNMIENMKLINTAIADRVQFNFALRKQLYCSCFCFENDKNQIRFALCYSKFE